MGTREALTEVETAAVEVLVSGGGEVELDFIGGQDLLLFSDMQEFSLPPLSAVHVTDSCSSELIGGMFIVSHLPLV